MAILLRVQRQAGDGFAFCAGHSSLQGVASKPRAKPSYCVFIRQERTGWLSLPVVVVGEGWSPRRHHGPPAAGSPGSGIGVASPCRR